MCLSISIIYINYGFVRLFLYFSCSGCCSFFFFLLSKKWFSSNNLNPLAPQKQQTDTTFVMDQIILTIIAKFLHTTHRVIIPTHPYWQPYLNAHVLASKKEK